MKRANARKWAMALAVLASACGAAAAPPSDPSGQWVTASRNLVVTVGACGAAMCGTVAQVLANNSMSAAGEAAVRPLPIGYQLMTGLHRAGDHWSGRIFNRENGRTYDCEVRALPDGTLEVRPFVGLPIFGRTQIWVRAG